MIRGILGSALPILGLGLVAAFAGPDLVTGLRGEPMLVSTANVNVEPTSFSGEVCASHLVLGKGRRAGGETPEVQVIALALQPDGQIFEVAIRNVPTRSESDQGTVILLLDQSGQLIAVSRQPDLFAPSAPAHADCLKAPSGQKRV